MKCYLILFMTFLSALYYNIRFISASLLSHNFFESIAYVCIPDRGSVNKGEYSTRRKKKNKTKPHHYNEYILLTMKIYLLNKESTDASKVNRKFKCISKDQGQQEV